MKRLWNIQISFLILLMLLALPKVTSLASNIYILPEDDKTGYPVTGVGEQYEKGNLSIQKLVVPVNITRIGEEAFMDCVNIEEIILTSQLEVIGANAFYNTAYYNDETNWDEYGVLYIGEYLIRMNPEAMIDEYTVRPGTRLIAAGAFEGCANLEKITIPESVEFVGENAFRHTLLNKEENWDRGVLYVENILVDVDTEKVSEVVEVRAGTRIIADAAFRECNVVTKVICETDSLKRIGKDAFESCGELTTIQIGAQVQSVGYAPFRLCPKLQKISVDEQNKYFTVIQDVLYDKELTRVVKCPTKKKGSVHLPESIVHISTCSFEGCYLLSEVIIPDGTLFIGQSAFSLCYNLKNIRLPESMEYVSSYAFEACTSLVNIIIPDTVYNLGAYAFKGCEKLESVDLGEGISMIKSGTFADCTVLDNVEMGERIVNVAQDAFDDTVLTSDSTNYEDGLLVVSGKYLIKVADDLEICEIPYGIITIAEGALLGDNDQCEAEKIYVPISVSYINANNFEMLDRTTKVFYEGSLSFWQAKVDDERIVYDLTTWDERKKIERIKDFLVVLTGLVIGMVLYNMICVKKEKKHMGGKGYEEV